jgi:hypothetical protein
MCKYNEVCDFIAERAFALKISDKYTLHDRVYKETRQKFGEEVEIFDYREEDAFLLTLIWV